MATIGLVLLVSLLGAAPPPDAHQRALGYLEREVPSWSREHRCFSCHNNADAARALYTAIRLGRSISSIALADTTRWLARPAAWDHNGGEGPFNDRKLARLQFAATLAEARAAGAVRDGAALEQAARSVVKLQDADGSWRVALAETVGSPATHGTALATALARRTLSRTDAERHARSIARADAWLRRAPVDTVLDAGAVLLGLGRATDADAGKQRRRAFEPIRKGEARGGGWGPYVNAPPEVFDTAVVVLALAGQEQTEEVKRWVARGRSYLLATQYRDGSWPETTRPSGAESYAQRLATTGWAALALVVTRGPGTRGW